MLTGFSIREFVVQFLGHELVEKILGGGGKVAEEKLGAVLKANIGGFGVNDEVLFWDACEIAVSELSVTKADIIRIMLVLKSLEPKQRGEVVRIIGLNEQEVKNEEKSQDGKGKPVSKIQTEKRNMRGARFVALLAKMTDEEIKTFLLSSGAMETTADDIEAILEEMTKMLGKRWKTLKSFYVNIKDTEGFKWIDDKALTVGVGLKFHICKRGEKISKRPFLKFW